MFQFLHIVVCLFHYLFIPSSSRNLLEEHINTHTGARPYVCQCGKSFASKYTYKAHIKIHEQRPRPFACTECDKTFLTSQNLTQHLRTHSEVKNFICKQCGKNISLSLVIIFFYFTAHTNS